MIEPIRSNRTVTVAAVTATDLVRIHATRGEGQPGVTLTGVPAEVAVSTRDRLYAAIANSGLAWPIGPVELEVSAAGDAVTDSALDAALAVALLAADGQLPDDRASSVLCVGELGLDGGLRPVRDLRTRLAVAADAGLTHVLVPAGDPPDHPGLVVRPAQALADLVDLIRGHPAPHTEITVEEVRIARASLGFVFEPGSRHLHDLVAALGPVGAYRRLRDGGDLPVAALRREVRHWHPAELWDAADRAVDDAQSGGGRIVIPEDLDWPPRLTDLATAAADTKTDADTEVAVLCLWARGEAPVAATLARSVTITGARAATSYGTHLAAELGSGCAEHGWTVVAGGAFGIDSAAHRGALTGGGVTVAVLPCGLDRAHPAGNRDVFAGIVERGLLLSAWPDGTLPTRARFLTRQRLLAVLSVGTVLVEATARSSSLATLEQAIRLERPAMVVPGPVTSAISAGCHHALRHHRQTRLVTSVDDVMAEVHPPTATTGRDTSPPPGSRPPASRAPSHRAAPAAVPAPASAPGSPSDPRRDPSSCDPPSPKR